MWETAKFEKKNPNVAKLLMKFDTVLGLKIDVMQESNNGEIPEEILGLLEKRKVARDQKDWKKSDEIRDLLKEKGYMVKDTKNGQELDKI